MRAKAGFYLLLLIVSIILQSLVPLPVFAAPVIFGGTGCDNPQVFYSAAITSTTALKTVGGSVCGWYYLSNPNASQCSLDIFNAATGSVSLGSTTPVLSFVIPANGGATIPPVKVALATLPAAISAAGVTAAGGGTTCGSGLTVNLWIQ